MSVHEEIREQRKKLKGQGFKAHLSYFWDYYKVHTFVALILIIFLVILIRDVKNNKPAAFYAVLVNSGSGFISEDLSQTFADYAGIDTKEYDCNFDTSTSFNPSLTDQTTLAAVEKVIANISAKDLDVMVADESSFSYFANQEDFIDLTLVFTKDELATLEPYIVYVDQAYLDYLNSDEYQAYISSYQYDTSNKYAVMAADFAERGIVPPLSKDDMENPIPIGLRVPESSPLVTSGAYEGTAPICAIVVNTQRIGTAKDFIRWALGL